MSPFLLAAALAPSTELIAFTEPVLFPIPGTAEAREYTAAPKGGAFREAIASWNVEPAQNAALKIQVRAHGTGFTTKWYTLAEWSKDAVGAPRISVEGQKDEHGNVLTDTLRLAKPAERLDVRVTLRTLAEGPRPRLKLLTLSLSGKGDAVSAEPVAERSAAWGKVIEAPQRAQGNYPRGEILCSPTSLSMVLAHWAKTLGRPELDKDVPEVEAGVWDSVYEGAGNWPFNTAYAGTFPGIRAYVARLGSIRDLERWIEAGVPVICSAPLALLRGQEKAGNSGHLVVLVGFTATGDPVFNDPARKAEVRKIYKRADFERAWSASGRTVYLVYPEGMAVPKDSGGLWVEGR